jgi:hypothetical protein
MCGGGCCFHFHKQEGSAHLYVRDPCSIDSPQALSTSRSPLPFSQFPGHICASAGQHELARPRDSRQWVSSRSRHWRCSNKNGKINEERLPPTGVSPQLNSSARGPAVTHPRGLTLHTHRGRLPSGTKLCTAESHCREHAIWALRSSASTRRRGRCNGRNVMRVFAWIVGMRIARLPARRARYRRQWNRKASSPDGCTTFVHS